MATPQINYLDAPENKTKGLKLHRLSLTSAFMLCKYLCMVTLAITFY